MTQNRAQAFAFDLPLPTGAALDARDPVFRDNPHPRLDELRARAPVFEDRTLDRIVLTRAEEVAAALADRTLSSDPFKGRSTTLARRSLVAGGKETLSLLFMDDPDHGRLRGLVAKAFTFRAIEAVRPTVESLTAQLLESVDPGRPFDLIAELATPLPVLVIMAMLGIDHTHALQIKLWSDAMLAQLAPDRSDEAQQRLVAARDGFNGLLAEAITERRRRRQDDLLGDLVAAEHEGEKLTETEILNTCRLLLIAGNVTTTDLIGNGAVALLRHPDQLAMLRSDPTLMADALEEILRYDPPVVAVARQAPEERRIGGCPVAAGQTITAMLLAANHDPAIHAEPHRFDIGRAPQKHLSFGGGSHFCLGASLARLETQVALTTLLGRFPKLRLVPGHELQRKAQPGFNGFEAVWVVSE